MALAPSRPQLVLLAAAAALLASIAAVAADDSVHVRASFGISTTTVTSSTLRWSHGERGARPNTSFVGAWEVVGSEKRPVYVCQARHSGVLLPGRLRAGHPTCHVTLTGTVASYEVYEVLENPDEAALLTWVPYSRLDPVPKGAIAAGSFYVARTAAVPDENQGFTHFLGGVPLEENQGKRITVITANDSTLDVDKGEILVEIEPIAYELDLQADDEARKVEDVQVVELGSATLRNQEETPGLVATELAYVANTSMYWGKPRSKAMITALPTKVRYQNGTAGKNFKWGIVTKESKQELARVEMNLPPGTAVNVSLVGNLTDSEIPYRAKLVSVYPEHSPRSRVISSTRKQLALLDVRPVFGPIYFLANDSLVPTTTTTTTTTTSTTTTTTTTTTTEAAPPPTSKKPKKTLPGESDEAENSSVLDHGTAEHQRNEAGLHGEPAAAGSSSAMTPLLATTTVGLLAAILA